MKHFSIELRAASPLAIRSDYALGGAETIHFIPGTTLLGSLASAHRMLRSTRTEEFEELFLNGHIHYSNLYPATFSDKGMQESRLPVYPTPRTAQSCKRFPGFRQVEFPGYPGEGHGVRDRLLDWAIFKLSESVEHHGSDKALLQTLRRNDFCQYNMSVEPNTHQPCGEIRSHFIGYYRRERFDPHNKASGQIYTRLQRYVGIDRQSGTLQDGTHYNREVLEEGMRFWGLVKLPDMLASTFAGFVDEVADSGLVRIGTGKSRGLGKVILRTEQMEEEKDEFLKFKERLVTFTRALSNRAHESGVKDLKPFYFALTLHSPLILYDHILRYRGTIDGETFAGLIDQPSSSFQLIYQSASIRRVMGRNELWGTHRTIEFAIDTGSVFLFASSLSPEETLLRQLFRVEEQDIGRRRGEGFGRVLFSDPFHLEETANE